MLESTVALSLERCLEVEGLGDRDLLGLTLPSEDLLCDGDLCRIGDLDLPPPVLLGDLERKGDPARTGERVLLGDLDFLSTCLLGEREDVKSLLLGEREVAVLLGDLERRGLLGERDLPFLIGDLDLLGDLERDLLRTVVKRSGRSEPLQLLLGGGEPVSERALLVRV